VTVEVIVATWDNAAYCWPPFAWCFEHYWPDRPWRTRFTTNELDAPLDGAIKLGSEETRWTPMQRAALQQVEADVVFYVAEDVWLVYPVDTAVLREFAGIVERNEADVLRVYRSHQGGPYGQGGMGSYEPDPRLFVVDPAFPYFTNLQASFWRRQVLLDLLGPDDESSFFFETTGSGRARQKDLRVLCVDAATTPDQAYGLAYFPTIDAACRGHWRLAQWTEQQGGAVSDTPVPDLLKEMIGCGQTLP